MYQQTPKSADDPLGVVSPFTFFVRLALAVSLAWVLLPSPAVAAVALIEHVAGDWSFAGCGENEKCEGFRNRTRLTEWQLVIEPGGDVHSLLMSESRTERDQYVLEGRFLLHNRKSDAGVAGELRLEDEKLILRYRDGRLAGIDFPFRPTAYDLR